MRWRTAAVLLVALLGLGLGIQLGAKPVATAHAHAAPMLVAPGHTLPSVTAEHPHARDGSILPAPELFPTEDLKKVDEAVLTKEGQAALQYGTTEGYTPLREQIAGRMKKSFMVDCTPENIVITSGSQQGLSLLAQIFLNPGDVVLVESPTYLGAINAFKLCGPEFVEVPTDDKGIIPEELEKILAKYGDRVRMMYVIPEFQNPTGITWPMERRKAFMDIINRYDFPVLEDDPYGELRFDGDKVPSLKSMDTKGSVL